MAKFNEYPAKATPEDEDKFMLYSAEDSANKLIDYDKLADAVLDKLTSKQFTLDQGTKTLLSALNELNSNTFLYTDDSTNELSQKISSASAYIFFTYGGGYDDARYCSCVLVTSTQTGALCAIPLYKGEYIEVSIDQLSGTVQITCSITTLRMGVYKIN